MNTPPADLPEAALRAALQDGWSLRAEALDYRAVGFGSHHWELTDVTGARRFVTVDDLCVKRRTSDEPVTAAYRRLLAALTAAQALRAAGRDFVVAPLPTHDGEPLAPLGDRFAVAVYPFVTGRSFAWDGFTPPHRRAVLDLLVSVHTAPPEARASALADDYTIPSRDVVTAVLAGRDTEGGGRGPYAQAAIDLFTANAAGVRAAYAAYDRLVAGVRADPPGAVLTHGEPHAGNTMHAEDGWRLIDWDTALVAPPERDLWSLDPGDGTLLAAYRAATGTRLRPDVLGLYRLRWNLADIAVCLARFREPHGASTDDEQTWAILQDTVAAVTR